MAAVASKTGGVESLRLNPLSDAGLPKSVFIT
jgi:hypothetical protein